MRNVELFRYKLQLKHPLLRGAFGEFVGTFFLIVSFLLQIKIKFLVYWRMYCCSNTFDQRTKCLD